MRELPYDYGFRDCPAEGLFRRKTSDPLYLCDEFGDILAWPGDIVLTVT